MTDDTSARTARGDIRRRDRPRRDADGQIAFLGDLLGVALAGLVCGVVVLLVFETITSLARLSRFGAASDWLALILPAWLFAEEFRRAQYGAGRVAIALLAVGCALTAAMIVANSVSAMPPLASGGTGATVATIAYAVVWFYGHRWLRHHSG